MISGAYDYIYSNPLEKSTKLQDLYFSKNLSYGIGLNSLAPMSVLYSAYSDKLAITFFYRFSNGLL